MDIKHAQGVVIGRPPEISTEAELTIGAMRQKDATMAAIADRLNDETA